MMGTQRFKIVIANEIPERLREGRLYVSLKYRTASHLCPCGCGNRVVTPFSSGYWTMRVVLWGVTLQPSIGNWHLPCQSHYWIRKNRVVWAPPISGR
jgi:hypothetical protein